MSTKGEHGSAQRPTRTLPLEEQHPGASERARTVGRGLGTGARATARGVRGVAQGAGQASRYAARQAKRAADAQGADESGLSRLLQLHAFNAAGDAAVTISLAGTLFFQVPSGEARGQVALFLALTMLPLRSSPR